MDPIYLACDIDQIDELDMNNTKNEDNSSSYNINTLSNYINKSNSKNSLVSLKDNQKENNENGNEYNLYNERITLESIKDLNDLSVSFSKRNNESNQNNDNNYNNDNNTYDNINMNNSIIFDEDKANKINDNENDNTPNMNNIKKRIEINLIKDYNDILYTIKSKIRQEKELEIKERLKKELYPKIEFKIKEEERERLKIQVKSDFHQRQIHELDEFRNENRIKNEERFGKYKEESIEINKIKKELFDLFEKKYYEERKKKEKEMRVLYIKKERIYEEGLIKRKEDEIKAKTEKYLKEISEMKVFLFRLKCMSQLKKSKINKIVEEIEENEKEKNEKIYKLEMNEDKVRKSNKIISKNDETHEDHENYKKKEVNLKLLNRSLIDFSFDKKQVEENEREEEEEEKEKEIEVKVDNQKKIHNHNILDYSSNYNTTTQIDNLNNNKKLNENSRSESKENKRYLLSKEKNRQNTNQNENSVNNIIKYKNYNKEENQNTQLPYNISYVEDYNTYKLNNDKFNGNRKYIISDESKNNDKKDNKTMIENIHFNENTVQPITKYEDFKFNLTNQKFYSLSLSENPSNSSFKLMYYNSYKSFISKIKNVFNLSKASDHCLLDNLINLWVRLEISYEIRYKILDFLSKIKDYKEIYMILDKENEILVEYICRNKDVIESIKQHEKYKTRTLEKIIKSKYSYMLLNNIHIIYLLFTYIYINTDKANDYEKTKFITSIKSVLNMIYKKENEDMNEDDIYKKIIWNGVEYKTTLKNDLLLINNN